MHQPVPTRRHLLGTVASFGVLPIAAPAARDARQGNQTASEANGPSSQSNDPNALLINGERRTLALDPDTTLLDALREQLGLTGTKKGCDMGSCGACTVHVDGERVLACLTLAVRCEGKQVTTIEGLAQNGQLHKVQKAWLDHQVPQCGYCQCGMIMAVAALLNEKPKPTDADIDRSITNICRCGTYQQVREAIHAAANA